MRDAQRRRRAAQREEKKVALTYPPVPDDEAGALIEWARKSLITPPGHHLEGTAMTLPDYGEKFIRDALAKDCKDSLLCMGRKSGKTAIIAILVLGHLVGPLRRRGWRCALASTSRETAGELRGQIEAIATASGLAGSPSGRGLARRSQRMVQALTCSRLIGMPRLHEERTWSAWMRLGSTKKKTVSF